MNKLYRLPLRMGSKTQLSDGRRRRKSPNLVVIGILALGALFALTAIGLTVFGAFKQKAIVPQEVGVAPPPPAADASPAAPENKENNAVMPLANPNPAPSVPVASSHPASDPKISAQEPTATPARSSTPAVTSASAGQKHEHKPEAETKSPDKSVTKARQTLEKKRMEAERKRARLEQKYENHEISDDAYNKGEQEYKSEIQKYRNELKSGT
jgi:colicin import membrane protein